MNYVFAGNRDIAVWIIEFMTNKGYFPSAILLTENKSEEAKKIIRLSKLDKKMIFIGNPNRNVNLVSVITALNPDYIIGIHYPYLIKDELLNTPKKAFINLHPAYLPFNRGWHTPSWAILENTPIGATLHEMSKELDMGDIINRKKIKIKNQDTANSLYKRLKKLEFDVFKESFDSIVNNSYKKIKQTKDEGSSHKKIDLLNKEITYLNVNGTYLLDDLLTRLRALTTNDVSEACFFTKDNKKYRIQINITEEKNNDIPNNNNNNNNTVIGNSLEVI